MLYLKNLITENTPIIKLSNDYSVSKEEKKEILGTNNVDLEKQDDYMKMMYFMNNSWYYFKEEEENLGYPFYLMDELMGSFLAHKMNMKVVSYFLARVKNKKIGLASKNFKQSGFHYYFGKQYYDIYENYTNLSYAPFRVENIENLKLLCVSDENRKILTKHILEMLALDVYMLQKDRKSANLQFEERETTKYIDLAPLYDFSNCIPKIEEKSGLELQGVILRITDRNIKTLIKQYPYFANFLSSLLETKMSTTWEEICEFYQFNQNCTAFEEVYNYYKTKEESQRRYLGMYLK